MARSKDFSRGLVAGALAGLAASYAMSEFQALWRGVDEDLRKKQSQGEPATVKVANAASQALSGEPVPRRARRQASELVHYLTGAGIGMVYGVLAEFTPGVTAGFGSVYGGMTWAILDEGLTPALGFSPPPTESDTKDHLFGLASHVAYGWTLELTRSVFAAVL